MKLNEGVNLILVVILIVFAVLNFFEQFIIFQNDLVKYLYLLILILVIGLALFGLRKAYDAILSKKDLPVVRLLITMLFVAATVALFYFMDSLKSNILYIMLCLAVLWTILLAGSFYMLKTTTELFINYLPSIWRKMIPLLILPVVYILYINITSEKGQIWDLISVFFVSIIIGILTSGYLIKHSKTGLAG